MKTINNELMESKRVTFEPGNCTRYDLLISKLEKGPFVLTDLNTKQVVLFHEHTKTAEEIELRLKDFGYYTGDARPMAEFLEKAFTETHYYKYGIMGAEIEYGIKWCKNEHEEREHTLDMIADDGGHIIQHGEIWS